MRVELSFERIRAILSRRFSESDSNLLIVVIVEKIFEHFIHGIE